jgi:hypothetical protein
VRPYVKNPARAPTGAATAAAVATTGARYQICADGGTYLLSRAGTREPKPFELDDLSAAVRHQLAHRFLAEVSSVNCLTPGRAPGLRTALRADNFSPGQLARALTAAADGAAPGATIYLEVHLLPPPGPRCAADDPACEPLPYQGRCAEQTGYDPRATRKPAGMLRHAGGACSYDGECIIGGCGNDCGPPAIEGLAGTCELYEFRRPVYCGCVNRRCAWFMTD